MIGVIELRVCAEHPIGQALEVCLDHRDVAGELLVGEIYLTNGEDHLASVRVSHHAEGIGDDPPRRECHVVVENTEVVPRDEADAYFAHRRGDDQLVAVVDDGRLRQASRFSMSDA